jgi:hypothetical protein
MDCCQSASCCQPRVPERLQFNWIDLFKVLSQWLFAFTRIFNIKTGLYYTGNEYDVTAPLLVTANYHLTVWSVWRRIRRFKTRILVIDTDGINVWCSSGKGKFCSEEIIRQIELYPLELLSQDEKIELILPKLSLSGVRLSDLRSKGIIPVIGPVYAGDIPAFLNEKPYRDCNEQIFRFDLLDRIFTLVPSWVQIVTYSIDAMLVLGILHLWLQTGIWWQVLPISLLLTTTYILGFPYLPTRSFVYKGMSLFLLAAIIFYAFIYHGTSNVFQTIFYLSYIAGFSVFFGLYYTGNSGVSNYSIVKRETVLFLPLAVLFLLVSLVSVILKGVLT